MNTGTTKTSRGRKLAIAVLCAGIAAAGAFAYFLLRGEEVATPGFPGEHHVVVYLEHDIEDDVREQVESALREHPLTEQIQFESQAEAWDKFQDIFSEQPAIANSLDADNMPSAFKIKLTDGDQSEEFIREFEDTEGIYHMSDLMEVYRYFDPACIEFEDKGISAAEDDTESILHEIEQMCSSFGYDL